MEKPPENWYVDVWEIFYWYTYGPFTSERAANEFACSHRYDETVVYKEE